MKLLLPFSTIFFLFSIHVHAQETDRQGYLINGTVKAIDSGIIRMLSDNGDKVLDSSLIVRGKFEMKGRIGSPERRLFTIRPGNWSFQAFVEDTVLRFTIDTSGAEYHGQRSNKWVLLFDIEETGSKLADVYKTFEIETNQKQYVSVFSSLNKRLQSAKGHADLSSGLEHAIDSVKERLLSGQKLWIENYIRQYPSSIAGVYLFSVFYALSGDTSPAYLQSILDKFSGPAKTSVYYTKLTIKAANLKQIQANSVAPVFTLLKRDKTKFILSSTRGSYTIIDFWASWCAPCRKDIPTWKKVFAKYHQKGLAMVSVSNDRDWKDWTKALEKEQMPWIQVIDDFPKKNEPSRVATLYGFATLPYYVLLDKEGKVILSSGNEEILTKKLEEVFLP